MYIFDNLTDGATADFEGETYTYTNFTWFNSDDEVVTDTALIAGIQGQWLNDNLSEGATTTYNGTEYTFDGSDWTYEVAANPVIAAAIVAEYYSPAEGDEQELDGITYEYTEGEWQYETTTAIAATAEVAAEILAEWQAENTASPETGTSFEYDGTRYTYENGSWIYQYTNTETATAEVAAAIIAEYYPTPAEGDAKSYGGVDYTYENGEWTYEVTSTETADSDTVIAIFETYYPAPAEGDEQDYNGVTYTYDGSEWTYLNTVTETLTADSDTAATLVAEYYTPAEGDTQTLSGSEYTYADGAWTALLNIKETADSDTVIAIIAEYYTPSDSDTQTLNDIEYTFDGTNWTYLASTTGTADSAIAAAIVEEYYNSTAGDTLEIDGTTYTFNGTEWTYLGEPPTITAYYQFSDSVSSADAPVVIQSAETDSDTENTSIASPAYINGTGEDFVVAGVGTVSGLDDGEIIIVTASDNSVTDLISGLIFIGDIELAGSGKNVALDVNGAQLNYSTAEKGETVSLAGTGDSLVIAQAANAVTLKSIDDKQEWILNDDPAAALTFGKVAYSADSANPDSVAVYAADSNGALLATNLYDGDSLILARDGSNRSDSIRVNGTTISSAAKTAGADSSTISNVDNNLVISAGERGGVVSVNGGSVELAAGAHATIEGIASDAAVTAVDALDSKGKWITDGEVTLNNQVWSNSAGTVTLTGNEAGDAIAKATFTNGTVALNAADTTQAFEADDININGKATWDVTGKDDNFDDFAVFDANGNVTLTNDDRFYGAAELKSGKNITFTSGTTGDVLTISKGADIYVDGETLVSASSIAAGAAWSVKAERAVLGAQALSFEEETADSDGTRAVITADKAKGNVIRSITDLAGDATLAYGADYAPSGLTIADSTWTIKNADADSDSGVSTIVLDKDGKVTVTADEDSTLEVSGTSEADSGAAVVNISNTYAAAKLNGVNVGYSSDDANGVNFELEEKAHNAGIAAINGLDSAFINVDGDNSYKVNDYTYSNATRGDASFFVDDDSLTLFGAKDKDAVTLTGGDAFVHFADAEKATAAVSINGAGVTLDAADKSDIADIAISTGNNDKVGFISGADADMTINTTGDDKFGVSYVSPKDGTPVTLNVNDTTIEIDEGASYDTDTFTLSVDGSNVTLTGVSFGAADTLTVSGGNYKIGRSAAAAVTETLGYITFDQYGNATAVEKSVVDNEKSREGVIDSVEADALSSQPAVFALYQKLGTDDSGAPSSTVAGYENATDTTPATSSVDGGINIYGNTSLNSDNLTAVTLQSFTDDDIVVFEAANTGIRTSVIDVSQGSPSVVAIDPLTSTTGVDHTVLGGNNGNYIKFGANARGNNYAQAGSVASYLANEGGTATLIGGAGNDSIAAKKGDKVTGGAGADYFFDANGAYAISDYSAAQGDVIVASKLADINKNLDAETLISKIAVKGNTINISGGGKFTLGGSGSESSDATISALNVRFTDSNAQDIHKLTWAAADGGNVNASAFSEGSVLMVADQNNGASDSVVGSSGNDTIFVGGNDTVNAGAGKDEIYIKAANSAKKEEGAVVQLSGGRTYVHGWNFGFDNAAGANILETNAGNLIFDNKEDTLLAYNATDTIYFVDNDSTTEVFEILTGSPDNNKKVSLIRSSKNVQVTSDDEVADYYYAAADVNATITFAEGVGAIGDTISMGGGTSYNTSNANNFINIHNVALLNNGAATLVGTGDKDVVQLGGMTASDAQKHVSLGGGNDSLISGGTDTSVAGNTIYFGLENDGSDIINNFGYYQGSAADPDKAGADKIIVYNWDEGGASRISANANNIEIKVNDSSKLTIQESGGIDANNKIRYQLGYDGEERIMQVGQTSGAKNNFTYDKETFVYVGNQEATQDTLSVAASDDNVAVWLDNHHGAVYEGIGVIDASASTNTQLTLAGGAENNTIIGGGTGNSSSLWGGGYGNNELIAGDGDDMFFFTKCGSNDTITGFDAANDRVRLGDVTLADLIEGQAYFDGDDVKIQLKAESGGGSLTIKNANGAQVEVNNGDGSYRAYTANTSNQSWS